MVPVFLEIDFWRKQANIWKKELAVFPPSPVLIRGACAGLCEIWVELYPTKIPGKRHCTNVACQINDSSPNKPYNIKRKIYI